jgi:hypothetical protein
MLIETIISVASFFGAGSGPEFFEQKVILEPGANIISTSEDWNAVTMFTLDGSELPDLCYEDNQDCLDWHRAEETEGHAADILELLYFGDTRKKLIVETDKLVEVGVHFFNSTIDHRIARADLAENSQEYFDDNLSKSFRAAGQAVPRFFSRAEWGADGEGRIANRFERFFKPKRWKVFGEDQKALEPELRPKLVKTHDSEKNQLYWPIYKNPELRKLIIHHTGEAIERRDNTRTNFEIVRAIEKYHSYTRNWGDIGYNYIIDKQGNIYEGRSGGPDTLGAHTYGHNSLSLGISLMGNFNHEEPTKAQLSVLALLLSDHALRFDIDPTAKSSFLGKNSDNISGHRDVARRGHGTACPGTHLHEKLPQIREQTADFMRKIAKHRRIGARDFLARSSIAPNVQLDPRFKRTEKPAPAEFGAYTGKIRLNRGTSDRVMIRVKNNTDDTWSALSEIEVTNTPDGLVASKFRNPRPIRPGQSGIFRGTIEVLDATNGTYYLDFSPTFLSQKFFESQLAKSQLHLPVTVSGGQELFTASSSKLLQANSFRSTTTKRPFSPPSLQKMSSVKQVSEPNVKIKIADFDGSYASIVSDELVEIYSGKKLLARTTAGNEIKIFGQDGFLDKKLRFEINGKTWQADKLSLRAEGGIFRINNYQSARFGQGKIKYNLFRDGLNIHNDGSKKLLIVNELPMESYLWGLAEEPKTEPLDKQKAVHVLARSYAYVYSQGPRRKFQTFLYDLENDPRTSQLYLGSEWEKYHQNQKNILAQTRGQVVTHNGAVVIAPYFTQSSGRSSDAWAKQYPWAKVQPLPFDEGLEAKGHGIGLSGNSARVLAEKGKNYKAIIDYFFEGVVVKKKY